MDGAVLGRALEQIAPLTPADRAAIAGHVVRRAVDRGTILLREGDRCDWLGVVGQGVVRECFVLPSGIERTKSFAVEGDLVGSLPDVLADRVASCTIVAEDEAVLHTVESAAFLAWLASSDGTRRWGWALLRRQYLRKADRERELAGMDANQRYAAFRKRFPGLEARISQRLVASYVGITPEHLSRLRSRAQAGARQPENRSATDPGASP